jgi:hypothetical protein
VHAARSAARRLVETPAVYWLPPDLGGVDIAVPEAARHAREPAAELAAVILANSGRLQRQSR